MSVEFSGCVYGVQWVCPRVQGVYGMGVAKGVTSPRGAVGVSKGLQVQGGRWVCQRGYKSKGGGGYK